MITDDQKKKYLKMACEVSMSAGCVRSKRGTVIVRGDEILVQDFNTVLPENDYCQKNGCLRDKLGLEKGKELEKCRAIHSEAKALIMAAKKGILMEGAVVFITCAPCINCAKLLAVSGIKEVYYIDLYGDDTGTRLLQKMGIRCERFKLDDDKPEERLRDTGGQ